MKKILGLVFLMVIFSISLSANLSEGLQAFYPFNGNANDESGSGNNGNVSGATFTDDRFGNSNSALAFDGYDDYVGVNNNSLSITQNLTISYWAKNLDTSFSDSQLNYVISKGTIDEEPYNDYYSGIKQNLKYFLTIRINNVSYIVKTTPVTDNLFHHITGIYDYNNSLLSIYLDGIIQQSIPVSGQINNTNSDFIIGDWDGVWCEDYEWHFFNGTLDDIRIYNRALSPSEIQELYGESNFSADFVASPRIAVLGTIIQFTDCSSGNPDLWSWDFDNDGEPDNIIDQNPSHIFALGTYSVSLTAYNTTTDEEDTETKSNYIIIVETLPPDPVANYPLDGNANDDSGNGNNGTVHGATPTNDWLGNANSALAFDGVNDYVEINNTLSSVTNDLSVCYRAKNLDSSFNDNYSNYAISKGVRDIYPHNDYCSGINLDLKHFFSVIINDVPNIVQTTSVTDNLFHHIAGIYDYANSLLSIYLDGNLQQSIPVSGQIDNTNNDLFFGDWNGNSGWHFYNGAIDDVKIYNQALTTSEIINENCLGSEKCTIQGIVTGTDGAVVSLQVTGDNELYTITNANGEYNLVVDSGSDVVITPTLSGCVFNPISRSIMGLNGNLPNQDFTASYTSGYSISGIVSGCPLPALLTLSGTYSGSAFTNSTTGAYTIGNIPTGNYTLHASVNSPGITYAFNPGSYSYPNLSSNQTNQNFTGYLFETYVISGTITGAPSVTVTLSGDTDEVIVTDGDGFYLFIVPMNINCVVTPSKAGFVFIPASRSYSDIEENYINQDYFATIAPLDTPVNVNIHIIIESNGASVVLTWDSVSGATSYKVWSCTNPAAPFPEGWTCESTVSTTEYVESSTAQGKYFRVVAVDNN